MKYNYRHNKKYGYMQLEPMYDLKRELLWNANEKRWEMRNDENEYELYMQYEVSIHSIKAAKRHLRKHNEIPKGAKFRLINWLDPTDTILIKR